jgi:uncharacterized protein YkwD
MHVRGLVRPALLVVLTVTLVASGLTLTAAGTASAAAADPTRAGTGSSGSTLRMSADTYERRVQYVVNRKRAAHGLRPLRFESCTDGAAERWALRLAASGTLVHQSAGDIMDTCHAYYAGETLGQGTFGPRRLVKSWMRSPLHRSVLLSKHARRIGVGTALTGSGQWVTAADFTRL